MSNATHHMLGNMREVKATLDELRDHLADFDDFARPFRGYLYWEPHCYDIAVCWAARSVFEAVDGVDKFSDNMKALLNDVSNLDAVLPQMMQQFPPIVAVAQSMRGSLLTLHIIPSVGETGEVVTAAGLVFAFTMMSMVASDLRSIGQAGSTIGLGLLFDTLVVRSLMTPSIGALLGRRFWWPLQVRRRPASYLLRPFGPSPLVVKAIAGSKLQGEE
ncbi:MAG: MMPL family transporter, partial [Mycobacterium sp.]